MKDPSYTQSFRTLAIVYSVYSYYTRYHQVYVTYKYTLQGYSCNDSVFVTPTRYISLCRYNSERELGLSGHRIPDPCPVCPICAMGQLIHCDDDLREHRALFRSFVSSLPFSKYRRRHRRKTPAKMNRHTARTDSRQSITLYGANRRRPIQFAYSPNERRVLCEGYYFNDNVTWATHIPCVPVRGNR